jgi:peptidoglycan/LPS O-acetylase OafA/YrhL
VSVLKYRPEVDGLRAVAVIPVVLFHLGASWLPGGFIGVDVFFVISGFLITSIILREHAAGTFTFSGFWMRRVRRILPAMLAMLIVTSVAGYFLMFGPSWNGLGRQVLSAIGIYANFEMWQLSGDYWGPAAESAPLLHTWSLSVEEQFYLFYPLLLLILLKFTPKRVFPIILAGSALSLAIGVYGTAHHPNATFYFLPPRAWELAAGCLLAIFERERGPAPHGNISRTLAFTGLFSIAAGYYLIQGAEGFPGFWALLPVVGTVLVIRFSGGEKCLAGRALGWAPVVFIGKCSYSLYLWHWPVIVLAAALKLKYPDSVNLGGIVVVMILLTLASYYFIEKPTRKMKRILPPVIVALVVSLGLAVFLLRADYEYDLSKFAPVEAFGPSYDVAPIPPERGEGVSGLISAPRVTSQYTAYANDGIIRKFGGEEPTVVVLGSSHGLMWGRTIEEICEELGLTVSFYTARAILPWIKLPVEKEPIPNFTADQRFTFDTKRLENLNKWAPRVIVAVDRWSVRGDPFQYSEFLKYIESCGSQVIIIGQPPELPTEGVSVPLFMAYQFNANPESAPETATLEAHRKEIVDSANSRMKGFSDTFDFCHFLPVSDLFEIGEDQVITREGDEVLYIDEDHLSQAGVQKAKARLRQQIINAFK